jgi:hypothetical protein
LFTAFLSLVYRFPLPCLTPSSPLFTAFLSPVYRLPLPCLPPSSPLFCLEMFLFSTLSFGREQLTWSKLGLGRVAKFGFGLLSGAAKVFRAGSV